MVECMIGGNCLYASLKSQHFAVGDFNWHLMLPTNAPVSPLMYSAVVATRYITIICAESRHMDHRHLCYGGRSRSPIRASKQCSGMQGGIRREQVALTLLAAC